MRGSQTAKHESHIDSRSGGGIVRDSGGHLVEEEDRASDAAAVSAATLRPHRSIPARDCRVRRHVLAVYLQISRHAPLILRPMVYLLNALNSTPARPIPPQRRRTIIMGGGATAFSVAFHLGEHSLLLERRTSLEQSYDHSHTLSLGAARGSHLGPQDAGTDSQGRGTLFIACSATGEAPSGTNNLIHVARWEPPALRPATPASDELEYDDEREPQSLRALIPLLRGEVRLGANVVRISPSLHLLELADGSRFVYDKLLSTLPIAVLANLVMHELSSRNFNVEFLSYWLRDYDIEVADRETRLCQGEVDEMLAGKRMADHIKRALAGRFQTRHRRSSLFVPRLVQGTAIATP
jgi:hypothetical protein